MHALGCLAAYWDLLPFGGDDAFATFGLWQALGRYAAVEQGIDDHPDWAIAATERPLSPAEICTLRDAIRRDFQTRFWNTDTGRFVGWIDLEGTPRDYGFTFLNTEAVAAGIASD